MAKGGLPTVMQSGEHDCAPACVSAVMRRWGFSAPLRYCTEALCTSEMDGTDPRTIEHFLRGQSLKVLAGEMDVSDLREQTKRERPVILVLAGHYAVAVACSRGRVSLMDPAAGMVVLSEGELSSRWLDKDRLGVMYDRWGLSVWREE
jgi:ABC-type bacteriocin/lantibiotic exporter with double-glycine peptidase domain